MYEMPVSGEIKTLAFKEGSSGVFTGSIAGLYRGYRFGSTEADVRAFDLDLPHGSLAVTITQEIRSRLGPRPAQHPFADGNDPFANLPPDPDDDPAAGAAGRPPGTARAGPPASTAAGGPHAGLVAGRPFYMEVMLRVDSEKSTGIFAGASGEVELATPRYQMSGYLVIETSGGDLRLDFLEAGERGVLKANLWVDGAQSTGIYRNARGDLRFALETRPPNFGWGEYSGTLWLEQEPSAS
jgi:hypothetical protein